MLYVLFRSAFCGVLRLFFLIEISQCKGMLACNIPLFTCFCVRKYHNLHDFTNSKG